MSLCFTLPRNKLASDIETFPDQVALYLRERLEGKSSQDTPPCRW